MLDKLHGPPSRITNRKRRYLGTDNESTCYSGKGQKIEEKRASRDSEKTARSAEG